jgi:hypothetical protein
MQLLKPGNEEYYIPWNFVIFSDFIFGRSRTVLVRNGGFPR